MKKTLSKEEKLFCLDEIFLLTNKEEDLKKLDDIFDHTDIEYNVFSTLYNFLDSVSIMNSALKADANSFKANRSWASFLPSQCNNLLDKLVRYHKVNYLSEKDKEKRSEYETLITFAFFQLNRLNKQLHSIIECVLQYTLVGLDFDYDMSNYFEKCELCIKGVIYDIADAKSRKLGTHSTTPFFKYSDKMRERLKSLSDIQNNKLPSTED